jgi:hypothetical protein
MRRAMLVFMRFALLGNDRGWKLSKKVGQQDPEEYRRRLFSKERLQFRLWALEHLSFKSVVRNAKLLDGKVPVFFCVMTSNELPEWAKQELSRIVLAFPGGRIRYCGVTPHYPKDEVRDETTKILETMKSDVIFSTTSLDDDDLLADTALKRLSAYVKRPFVKHAVSFANGIVGHFDTKTLEYQKFCELYLPMSSVGISYINKFNADGTFAEAKYATVVGLGGHLHVDMRVPLIIDARRPGWIRTMHSDNDVKLGVAEHWSVDLPTTHHRYLVKCVNPTAYPISAKCRAALRSAPAVVRKHSRKTRAAVTGARLKAQLRKAEKQPSLQLKSAKSEQSYPN